LQSVCLFQTAMHELVNCACRLFSMRIDDPVCTTLTCIADMQRPGGVAWLLGFFKVNNCFLVIGE
jgi:hypothetical protein